MKRISIIIALMIVTGLLSCKQEERVLTPKEVKAKADSIIGTRTDELKRQAAEDLEKRQAIEVKTKRDSIIEAYIKSQTPDTMAK